MNKSQLLYQLLLLLILQQFALIMSIPSKSSHGRFLRSFRSNASSQNSIQSIYDTLKSIPENEFKNSINHPDDCKYMQTCMLLCESITLSDLKITKDTLALLEKGKMCRCMHVCDDKKFEINIFLIPKGKMLPLHDHPGMAVISKVLAGTVRTRSFSRSPPKPELDEQTPPTKRARTADVFDEKSDFVTPGPACRKGSPDPAWWLTPSKDNIHELVAESTCVLFDILMPPYCPPERDCNYYSLHEERVGTDGAPRVLYRITRQAGPSDMDGVYGAPYLGIKPNVASRRMDGRQ